MDTDVVITAFAPQVSRGVNPRHHRGDGPEFKRVDELAVSHRAAIEARRYALPILRSKLEAVEDKIGDMCAQPSYISVKPMADLRRRQRSLQRVIQRISSGALVTKYNGMITRFEVAESVQRRADLAVKRAPRLRSFLPSDAGTGEQRTRALRGRAAKVANRAAMAMAAGPSAPPADLPRKANVVDEMRAALEGEAMPVQVVSLHDKCPNGHGLLVESLNMQHLLCRHPGCGHTQTMYKMTADVMAYGQAVGMTSSSYSRKGHLMDKFVAFLCKNRDKLDPDLKAVVCGYINRAAFKARVKLYEMGFTAVHTIMRRLQMTKLSKNIYSFEEWFTCLMAGTPPPKFSRSTMERIKLIHRALEAPYDKQRTKGTTTKSNYFNCNYFMHKAMRMFGLVEYLEYFPLQSCDSTLRDVDAIYLQISAMYKWSLLSSFKYDPAADAKVLVHAAEAKRLADSHSDE